VILIIIHLSEQSFKEKIFISTKIETEESKEDCLRREIKEEINIDITIGRSLTMVEHQHSHFSLQLYPFVCSLQSRKVKALEHAQAIWVAIDQLLDYDWAEADIPIVNEYTAYASSIK
jgi:8-oxo-dGTP diphosphatase